ncbi:MAG TPA: SPFH domain-containing protein [Phycisphaerae bacterium]|nr:SPFH domain-containing protein [Phycisphaerae bacterium]
MRKHMALVIAAVLVVAALLVFTVAFTVDELRDIVMVKQFGSIKADRIYGQKPESAGLHTKLIYPVEEVVRYKKWTHVFEDTHMQVQTEDKQSLLVTMFCFWKISEPKKFYQRNSSVENAESKIRDILRDAKQRVVGGTPMSQFVNTDPEKMKLPQIEQRVLDLVQPRVEEDCGAKVVMVGIKSLALPQQITETVIESMKEERQKFVKQYEAEGDAMAQSIREEAKKLQSMILDFAREKARAIETEGYRLAAKEFQAYQANPELARFLRYLETMRSGLKENAQVFLDERNLPAVKWLYEGAPAIKKAQK